MDQGNWVEVRFNKDIAKFIAKILVLSVSLYTLGHYIGFKRGYASALEDVINTLEQRQQSKPPTID